uniref:MD-2-related lipid-recognition domain-containing protein n=1 Tax=Anopheles minimus TaxID=112268 RepID=A0A182VYS4_9DIPT
MQLLGTLITLSLLSIISADVISVQQCSEGALPVSVEVAGCHEQPCELTKGQDVDALIEFKADRPLTALTPQIHASYFGINIPFNLPDDRKDACTSLVGGTCPVSEGQDVKYELHVPVSTSYPSVSASVELKLVDQDNNVVICFRVDGKLV